ncbi:Caudovirus prohead protease [Posidoniimonas corsicana]|uniref:Caudovirus prohead protease n=1 Tax=Posidoniimonas corsicana TaxID=1938618 RepID=A0A5C5VC84_9BACT|nr:HK97 family phage prohead protease [Posidoniimonas corsicana]TWT35871.1 Caudovirus prohead protease [Posidoniimonas corsicana]
MPQPIHGQRAAVAEPPRARVFTRAATADDEARTVEAVIATEEPAVMLDFESMRAIEETLQMDGAEYGSKVPLLLDHTREAASVIGSVENIRREGSQLVATLRFARGDGVADSTWQKVRDGHCDAVSVGYRILSYATIAPGDTRTVNGKSHRASDDYALRVAVKWELFEVSVVAIGADRHAKIRSNGPALSLRSSEVMPQAAPAVHSRNSVTGRPSLGALESALMMRLGINDPSRSRVHHDGTYFTRLAPSSQFERDAEEARHWAPMPLIDILRQAAAHDGVGLEAHGRVEFMNALFTSLQGRAGFSSASGDLLTNVFGAAFVDGYESVYDCTKGWTLEGENPTLQPTPRVRAEQGAMKKRGRGGVADHLDLAFPGEDTQLGEFAAQWTIDEMDVINNSFGNTEQLGPRLLGKAAARLRPLRVVAELLSNPIMRDGVALFHADHGNLQTGSALADGTLQSAATLMAKQTEGGQPLNLRGRYVLVPQALERTASKLARDVELSSEESVPPPVVRSDAQLDNGVIDPDTGDTLDGSATSWYLAAEGGPHTVEVSFKTGTAGQPQIRSGFLTQGQWGLWFDVQHWIGAQALDWRGLVRSDA